MATALSSAATTSENSHREWRRIVRFARRGTRNGANILRLRRSAIRTVVETRDTATSFFSFRIAILCFDVQRCTRLALACLKLLFSSETNVGRNDRALFEYSARLNRISFDFARRFAATSCTRLRTRERNANAESQIGASNRAIDAQNLTSQRHICILTGHRNGR